MKVQLSHFKKIHANKVSSTLRHKDGHEVKIAHAHINPKMRGEIEAMPLEASGQAMGEPQVQHMAQGGVAQDDGSMPVNPVEVPQPVQRSDDPAVVGEDPIAKNKNLPPDFEQKVKAEQARLAVNAGLPVTTTGENPAGIDLSKFRDAAETNVAQQHLSNQDKINQQTTLDYDAQLASIKSQNDIRSKAGLPLLAMPQAPPSVQQAQAMLQQPMGQQTPEQLMAQPPKGAQDPYGTQAYYDTYNKGIGEQKAGLRQEAQAQSDQAAMQAHDLEDQVQKTQVLNALWQKHSDEIEHERQAALEDYTKQHIDPQQYWHSQSTPAKISTAIGLILGGMGAGLAGGENPAMVALQRNIDRDIEGQKGNIGIKENILNANRQRFRNEIDADNMTRVMMNDLVTHQLKLAAAKTTDPLVKGRALQAIGQIDAQSAPIISQIKMRQAALGGAQQGVIDPSMAIRVIVPEHQQAAAYKELGEAQGMSKSRDNLLTVFDQLSHINTVGNRISSPIQTSRQVSALRDAAIARLAKDSAGRVTEQDVGMIGHLMPGPGENAKTIAIKRNQLNKFVSEKMNYPILKSYGIDSSSFGRFNPQGQSIIPQMAHKVR